MNGVIEWILNDCLEEIESGCFMSVEVGVCYSGLLKNRMNGQEANEMIIENEMKN